MALRGRAAEAGEGCRIAVAGEQRMPECVSGRFGRARPLCSFGEFWKEKDQLIEKKSGSFKKISKKAIVN